MTKPNRQAEDRAPDPVLVLVCDDAEASLGHWNEMEALAGSDGGRRIKRYGAPAKTAMEGVVRARNSPDAVLIDWKLPLRDGYRSVEPLGVWMVKRIAHELGNARPICVLWTANYDPCEALAFCELGGHHVIDKAAPIVEQLAVLRAATSAASRESVRWRPPPARSELTADELLVLPYVAAGWPNKSIARALADTPRGLSEAMLSQLRTSMKRTLCDGDPRPIPVCVPEAARDAGVCWVPVRYRHPEADPLDA